MTTVRNYWVVSPNVTNEPKFVEEWKEEILRLHSAMFGWAPDEYERGSKMGPKFAGKTNTSIQNGDVILIARRHKGQPDIVALGVVNGECKKKEFAFTDEPAFLRHLDPFQAIKKPPDSVPFDQILNHSRAMVQLHPDSYAKNPHTMVCLWMSRQLGLKDPITA